MATLEFDRMPAALPAFARVAMARGNKDVRLAEPLVATAGGVSAKPSAVEAYRRVCGGGPAGELPICYPQVMGFPLHMSLLGHRDFPLAAMGLVHVSNRIEQHRSLRESENFDVTVRIATLEETERGHEFELVTEFADSSGETVWTGTATILSRRGAGKSAKKKPPPTPQPSEWPLLEEWTLKGNLGRRYARVSGDVNPIHLTAPTARLLGFKRAIIHGMWTLARSAAGLPGGTGDAGVLEAEFKTPLFLPGRAKLHGESGADGVVFEVKDASSHKPILAGRWQRQES